MDIERLEDLVSVLESATVNHLAQRDLDLRSAVRKLRDFVTEIQSARTYSESVVSELKPFDADPTLDAMLEVAGRHKYQVTFTPTHDH